MTISFSAETRETNRRTSHRPHGGDWVLVTGFLLLILSVGSCDRDNYLKPFGYDRASLLKKYTPQDDVAFAMHCVDLLLQGQYEEIENRLDVSIKNSETRDGLARMASFFPSKPVSVKTVGSNVLHSRDSSTSSITLEYEFARGWLLAEVVVQTRDGVKAITGFHVTPIAEPVEVMNGFSLADKGISQYAGLCLAILISIFDLYVFVLCVRTKMGRKKWFWLILVLIGAGRLTLNWTTGQWSLTLLSAQTPPLMMFCSPYGPWIIQIAAPLGAIAFWRGEKRSLHRQFKRLRLSTKDNQDENLLEGASGRVTPPASTLPSAAIVPFACGRPVPLVG
jgi:hypothetical protein